MSDLINPFDDAEEIAKKTMVLFFIIDKSGSMQGTKIGTVNSVMEEIAGEIRTIGEADAAVKIAAMTFSSGCEWMYDEPVDAESFVWKDITTGGITDLGAAFESLADKLSRKGFLKSPSLSFAPVMILLSDGYPTDNYEKGLEKLKTNNWYSAGIKIAVAVGEDADENILAEFTGNKDTVVTVHNGDDLAKLIRFVSVTSTQIGSRSMQLADAADEPATKQEAVAEQIRDFVESAELTDDVEAGW